MVSILKSLQTLFQSIVGDLPEGMRVIFEFVWKARWFIVSGMAMVMVYNVVMQVLPYLMWIYVGKSVFGGLFTLFLGR